MTTLVASSAGGCTPSAVRMATVTGGGGEGVGEARRDDDEVAASGRDDLVPG